MRLSLVLAPLFVSSVAAAHISLVFPPPRTANQKSPVCGDNSPRGSTVTTLAPGSTITVEWRETINHPGHYRIAFDDDGQDFPIPPSSTPGATTGMPTVLLDPINDTGGSMFSAQVTLPNIECTNCTLQVFQMMTDKPPYDANTNPNSNDIYYQCADITLSASAPDAGPQPVGDAGVGGDAGNNNNGDASGGCSTGRGDSPFGALLISGLVAGALLAGRRRR